jgi:hypothetical protein
MRRSCTAKIFPPFQAGRLCKIPPVPNYGEGDADDVLVLELLLLEEPPLLGDEAVFTVVFVSVFSEVAGEADGLTTVVLFSVFLSAGGLVVSDFCSQAASRDAAPARMQMYFFIVGRWRPNVG